MTGLSLTPSVRSLIRRLPLAAAIVVAGVAAGYLATSGSAGYRSTAVLFVGSPGSSASTFYDASTQQGQSLLAVTFSQMVDTTSVVSAAVQSAQIGRTTGQALHETSATAVPGTSLVDVTVTDHDPQVAARLANAVATEFVKELATLDPVSTGTATSSPLSISQPAVVNSGELPTNRRHNVTRAGAFAVVIAAALLILLEYRDRTRRTPANEPD